MAGTSPFFPANEDKQPEEAVRDQSLQKNQYQRRTSGEDGRSAANRTGPRQIWDSIPTAFPVGQSGAGFGALGAGSINYCLAPICYAIQNLLKSDEMQGRLNAAERVQRR